MPVFFDFEKMFNFGVFRMLAGFGMICEGFGWLFLCVLAFSFLEGRYGRTPGKWIVEGGLKCTARMALTECYLVIMS
jgi:hypothetical protein